MHSEPFQKVTFRAVDERKIVTVTVQTDSKIKDKTLKPNNNTVCDLLRFESVASSDHQWVCFLCIRADFGAQNVLMFIQLLSKAFWSKRKHAISFERLADL